MDLLFTAVVELVAVVVGILVALWVNNWNQLRIRRQHEAAYLESLRADLHADVESLKQGIAFADGTAEAASPYCASSVGRRWWAILRCCSGRSSVQG